MEYGDIIPNEDGTAGQVLTSNGAGTQPTFQAAGSPAVTCAFSVYNSSPQNNMANSGANVPIILDNELFDIGGNFGLTANKFRAPVTGYYSLSVHCRLYQWDTAATNIVIRLITPNYTWNNHYNPKLASDPTVWFTSCNVVASMSAGHEAEVGFLQDGGTAQSDLPGSCCHFMGFLIGT